MLEIVAYVLGAASGIALGVHGLIRAFSHR